MPPEPTTGLILVICIKARHKLSESHACLIDVGMTVLLCDNHVDTGGYVDTTQCVVQPATGIRGEPEVGAQNVILQQIIPTHLTLQRRSNFQSKPLKLFHCVSLI
ncbi:MAG: hypothetical protein R3C26_00400 [Calditrichia bacterium]